MRSRAPDAQSCIWVPGNTPQQVTEGAGGPLPLMTLFCSKSREKAACGTPPMWPAEVSFQEECRVWTGGSHVPPPTAPHRSWALTPLVPTSAFPVGTPDRPAERLDSWGRSQTRDPSSPLPRAQGAWFLFRGPLSRSHLPFGGCPGRPHVTEQGPVHRLPRSKLSFSHSKSLFPTRPLHFQEISTSTPAPAAAGDRGVMDSGSPRLVPPSHQGLCHGLAV